MKKVLKKNVLVSLLIEGILYFYFFFMTLIGIFIRNFVRSPPTGVEFQFDYDISYPIAMAIMEQDPNLEKMRYELVPKM